MTRASGVPSRDELSKRTADALKVPLHELPHGCDAIGLIFMVCQVLHLSRITLQIVELIFVEESGPICSSNSDPQASDVRHGSRQVL
ncbi:MAG: hypothetical protein VX189_08475, partial [Planctomycetota bacterium]|nr:hypothetical protein [Planctomycetota bacterium]